ncbi:MFS transporter [Leucobacter sp. cx-42]|uniref:MFS transporter n=1 Tax=unclassified Leucobacter TaxID=2621730 RepID=UPI00165DDA16|nr:MULTISPECIES: MFS transporter [unclassified Leucobacter]MBC9953748.1 MFS transporter [Leucobacter sp. cx-42]
MCNTVEPDLDEKQATTSNDAAPQPTTEVKNDRPTAANPWSGVITFSGAQRTKRQVLRTWQTRIFLLSWLGYAAYYFPRNAFSAAKVGILEEGVLSRESLGILDSAYLAAYAVGQFVWGALAERFGTRVVVIGGMVLSAIAALFMGLIPALWLFMPLMIVQGLGQSTGWAAFSKNIASFFTTKVRGRAMGFFSTSYAFGGLIAVPVMGWVAYSVYDSWRWAFFTGAAVIIVALIVFMMLQRNNPQEVGLPGIDEDLSRLEEPYEGAPARRRRDDRSPVPVVKPANKFKLSDLLAAVRNDSMVLRLGIVYFMLKPARYAVLLWGPVLVIDAIPTLDAVTAVMVPITFGLAGVVAPIVAGWSSDTIFGSRRVPPTVIALVGLVITLVLWQPAAQTGQVWLVAVMLGLVGLTAYSADAMISGVAAVDFGTSKHAAGAAGFINGCGSVGAILGGLLPGFFDTVTVFYVFAATAAIAVIILIPSWNKRPASE